MITTAFSTPHLSGRYSTSFLPFQTQNPELHEEVLVICCLILICQCSQVSRLLGGGQGCDVAGP